MDRDASIFYIISCLKIILFTLLFYLKWSYLAPSCPLQFQPLHYQTCWRITYTFCLHSHLSISHQPIPIWHLSHYPLKDFCQGHQHSPGNKSCRRSSALISPTSWQYQTELLILHNLRHCLLNSMTSLFPVFLIPSPAIISQFLICKTSKHCCH